MNSTRQFSRSIRLEFARLMREEQDRRGFVDYGSGHGGAQGEAIADVFRALHGQARAAGEVTFAHVLAETVSRTFAETSEDRLMGELVNVAAVTSAWYESLRSRRGY